jgi:hypothetical protein
MPMVCPRDGKVKTLSLPIPEFLQWQEVVEISSISMDALGDDGPNRGINNPRASTTDWPGAAIRPTVDKGTQRRPSWSFLRWHGRLIPGILALAAPGDMGLPYWVLNIAIPGTDPGRSIQGPWSLRAQKKLYKICPYQVNWHCNK